MVNFARSRQSLHAVAAVTCLFAFPSLTAAQALVTPVPIASIVRSVTPAAPNVVTVVANDFAFDLPASIQSGLTTFRLLNKGKQEHHFSLMRLEEGKTVSDGFAALIKAGQGVRPAWMHPVGGPNAISPGGESRATVVLQPGNYMAYCEVPGPDPAPHFAKGMVKGLVVTGPASTASLPAADVAIKLTDFDFVFSRPLTRGHHVIAVTNIGTQPHMLVIQRHPTGKGNKEFLDWAFNPKGQSAPSQGAGGVTEIAPGATVVMERDFAPGRYGLFCFVPDTKTGKPHFMLGMQKEITVK